MPFLTHLKFVQKKLAYFVQIISYLTIKLFQNNCLAIILDNNMILSKFYFQANNEIV